MTSEEETLVEATLSAHRDRDLDGNLRFHPAFHDLDDAGRRIAFASALRARAIEASMDPEGLSPTVRAVLARIRGAVG